MKPLSLIDIHQPKITLESIRECLVRKPRRNKLGLEWPELLHEPQQADKDWSVVLPFEETFANTFRAGCHVQTIGLRPGRGGRCYTFLPAAKEDPEEQKRVVLWARAVGSFVGLRDCLAVSFALDYDRQNGDPTQEYSDVGQLRVRAKPYDRPPTRDTYLAADDLATRLFELVNAVEAVEPYPRVDAVVAMPPSDPTRQFVLPRYFGGKLAGMLDKFDGSAHVKTIAARRPLKSEALSEKLTAVSDTIIVDEGVFDNMSVLLVDDLYQSGVTMNYVAMLLLNSGATRVFGLSCVKTCRNDDNTGGRP